MAKKESFKSVSAKVQFERDYQDACVSKYFAHHGKANALDESRPIAAEIMMMDVYLGKSKEAWTSQKGDDAALENVRKVVAMGMRCLEYHGCPERDPGCDYVIK